MTTTHRSSSTGPGLARFVSTLVVCAGLLLIAAPVTSDHDVSTWSDTSACADSPHRSRGYEWTDDRRVNVLDSCSGDDDDDDELDGSDQALPAPQRRPAHLDDPLHIVHVDVDARIFRPLDAHSLRGPPADPRESSDADVDDDDDDDSFRAHQSVPLAAAQSRERHVPAGVDGFDAASLDSGHALRAPPA